MPQAAAIRRIAVLALVLGAFARSAAAGADDGRWGWDPAIAHAELENGVRIAVLPGGGDTVSVRLVSNTHAGNEEDIEIVHLAEHVAMSATRDGDDLMEIVRRLGMTPGPDANAHTAQTHVTFRFDLHGPARENLPAVLGIVRDIAGGSADPAARVRAESRATHAEHEMHGGRRFEASFHAIAGRALPPERLVHGGEDELREVTRCLARMLDPARLSLIVAGPVDAPSVLARASALMATLPPRSPAAASDEKPAASGAGPLVLALRDTSTNGSWADVIWSWPTESANAPGMLAREDLARDMVARVATRLAEKRLEAGPDVASGSVEVSGYAMRLPSRTALFLTAETDSPGMSEQLAERLLVEVERLRREPNEGVDARDAFGTWYGEWMWSRRPEASSADLADAAADAMRLGRVVVSPDDARLSGRQVSAALPKLLVERPFVFADRARIVVTFRAPESGSADAAGRVEAVLRALPTRDLAAPVPVMAAEAPAPSRGRIISRRQREGAPGEIWKLSNGMTVVVDRSARNDIMAMVAGARGGWQVDRARMLELAAASLAATPGRTGIDPRSVRDLYSTGRGKLASGLELDYRYVLGADHPGAAGSLMESLHRLFTGPPPARDAIEASLAAAAATLAKQESVLGQAIQDALLAPEWRAPARDEILAATADDAVRGWTRFFSDPAAWTVALAVDEKAAGLEESVETWLASIPRGDGAPLPVAPLLQVRREPAPLSLVGPMGTRKEIVVVAPARQPVAVEDSCTLRAILNARLHQILRTEREGTYSVQVGDAHASRLSIGLVVAADIAERDARSVAEIIARELLRLAREPPDADELDAALRGAQCRVKQDSGTWAEAALREGLGLDGLARRLPATPSPREVSSFLRQQFAVAQRPRWIVVPPPAAPDAARSLSEGAWLPPGSAPRR